MPKSKPSKPYRPSTLKARIETQDSAGGPMPLKGGAKGPKVSIWVKLLVLVHVITITSWSLPTPAKAVMDGQAKASFPSEWLLYNNEIYVKHSPIQLYLLSLGLWQSWDMFSPNPAGADMYSTADLILKNGQIIHYQYPRMYDLSRMTKYAEERYRKFFEHAGSDDDTYLWPYFAKRIVYLTKQDPANPIVKVLLNRNWYFIPRPYTFDQYSQQLWDSIKNGKVSVNTVVPPSPDIPTAYTTYNYYTYYPLTGTGVNNK
ncbi:MAG TPA: hypothetical protein VGL56_07270 [Fimbriimonadaceae bacterium]